MREQLLEEVESHGWERVHSREKRTFHRTLDTGSNWGGGGVDGGHVQCCPLFKGDDFIFKKKWNIEARDCMIRKLHEGHIVLAAVEKREMRI